MAKKAKSTSKNNKLDFLELKKEDILFDKINPRFAGRLIDPDDPTPYGDAIEDMYKSMLGVYRSTGKLLLQPVGVEEVEGKKGVRFGYTRAMTFVTRYEDLCKELGVKELAITAQMFVNIDEGEALVENLRRTDQHFMSTAYAVKSLREKGTTYKALIEKLSMSMARIKGLENMPEMNNDLQEMCYEGIVKERAAAIFALQDPKVQEKIAASIDARGYTPTTAEDAERVIAHCLTDLHKKTHIEAFTDIEGKEWPHVSEEPWTIGEADLMNSMKVLDKEAEKKRMKAYWTMIAEHLEVDEKTERQMLDRKYRWSESWAEVPMGTHPSEIAVWIEPYCLSFFVKTVELDKLRNPENQVNKRIESLDKRLESKVAGIRRKAKNALAVKMIEEVVSNKVSLDKDYLLQTFISSYYLRMKSGEKAFINKMLGIEKDLFNWNKEDRVEDEVLDTIDWQYVMMLIPIAELVDYNYVSSGHKKLLSQHGYDFDKEYDTNHKEDVEKEVKVAIETAKEKKHEVEDVKDEKLEFLKSLHETVLVPENLSLFDYITKVEDKDFQIVKYIAKGFNLKTKGNETLVAFRVSNAVKLLNRSYEIEVEAAIEDYKKSIEFFKMKANMFVSMYNDAEQTNSKNIKEAFKGIMRESDLTGVNDVLMAKQLDDMEKAILHAAATGKQMVERALVMEMAIATIDIANKDVDNKVKALVLNSKGKVRILG